MITRTPALSYERCTIKLHCKRLNMEYDEYPISYRTNTGLGYYVVPGYFYDERPEDDRFILTHLASGLHLGFRLFREEHLRQVMEQMAPLTDWTRSQTELQAEMHLAEHVRSIVHGITIGDFEQIPSEAQQAASVCEPLDELLAIALFSIGIEHDEIEGDVFFDINGDRCSITINGFHIALWNWNYALRDSLDPDWQVQEIERLLEVR